MKFAFFAPTAEIAENAKQIADDEGRKDVEILLVSTENCVEIAREAVANGADIIIARGTQAEAIKRNTDTPIVEIVLTAQEMGLVIHKAKKDLGIETPRLAVVGYRNMFCDMKHFNQLFDIELKEYYVEGTETLPDGVARAKKESADLVIGGEIVCRVAEELGMRCLMQPHGDDSIRQAFRVADSVAFAAEQEKKVASELNTLLDFSFSGLIKLGITGDIMALNSQIIDMFGVPEKELLGQNIEMFIPGLFDDYLNWDKLRQGRDDFNVVRTPKFVLAIGAAPIIVDNQIEGCIISCHEVNRLTEMEIETRREMQSEENRSGKFEQYFVSDTVFMRALRHNAKFRSHMLITSDPGTPRYIPAQYIHKESLRNDKPFKSFLCGGFPKEKHDQIIFGDNSTSGLLETSNGGTLFLDGIEELDRFVQVRLCNVLINRKLNIDSANELDVDLRVLAGTDKNLWKMVLDGQFHQDLYFAITTLVLPLPQLDAERWAPVFIQQYCNQHFRYLHLAKNARTAISEYKWNGLLELDRFCERLVITAPQRTADAAMIIKMLRQDRIMRETPERFTRDPEAARLADMLERYDGNRAMAAEALGISKTTLWRRMKKLGLYNEFAFDTHFSMSESEEKANSELYSEK